jgi:hypothetical protein
MNLLALRFILAIGVIAGLAAAQAPPGKTDQKDRKGEPVSGTACVRAGVEAGCVILATTDGKHTYLVIGKRQPRVGTVVTFTGTTTPDVVTACMQGTPTQLSKFTEVRMVCPLPEGK